MVSTPVVRDVDSELAVLAKLGFTGKFSVLSGGKVSCGPCSHVASARDVEILDVRRLEGPTDPSEARIILGLRCKACGQKGALALTYGPMATTEDADVLQLLDTEVWRARADSGKETES